MSDVQTLVKEARDLILAGDLDAGEKKAAQAKALAALESEVKSARLDFGAPAAETPAVAPESTAVKSWYTKNHGTLDRDVALMLNDLYGRDYQHLRWAKSADFMRYLRRGQADPELHRLVLYTPEQVMDAIAGGMMFNDIKATQVESQDQLGGYLVPPDWQNRMIERLQGLTPMRSIAETMNTMRDRIEIPVGTGGDDRYTSGVRVFKVDESPTSTQAETGATFGNVTIPVHTVMGHVAVSKNVLEDTNGATSIAPYLERQFASAYAVFEDEQFLIGNGVGGPQGILQNATTGGPFTYTYGSVSTVNSGLATALQGDAFRNLPYAIASQYRQAGGTWLMSRGTVRTVKTLKAGDGTYLWSGRGDNPQLAQGQPASLEGFPIRESEVLASPTTTSGTTYTANVYPVIFVTRGSYLIVDRSGGMDVTRYDDSTTAKTNQIVLVLRRRVGGQVILPWGIATMKVSA